MNNFLLVTPDPSEQMNIEKNQVCAMVSIDRTSLLVI